MKTYNVTFTFGAVIPVEAVNEEAAQELVEQMDSAELFELAESGFEVQDVEEQE
jgi:hypothetical protein